jgi:dTDP-4-amino-4,6-dideoxygalactose transaminase
VLGAKEGDDVLVPASICRVVIEAYLGVGLKIRRYALDGRLQPMTNDLCACRGPRTVAVHLVYQFGMVGEVAGVAARCRTEGLQVIEDRALCAYTSHSGGDEADAVVFSPWKTCPVPDGGILRLRHGVDAGMPLSRPAWKAVLRRLPGVLGLHGSRRRPVMHFEELPEDSAGLPLVLQRMSGLSAWIFSRHNHEASAARRREHYRWLRAACADMAGCEPLLGDPEPANAPYCLPVIVEDAVSVHARLCVRGIDAEVAVNPAFSGHPRLDARSFPDLTRLSRRILALPVHQGLHQGDLERIRTALAETLCR